MCRNGAHSLGAIERRSRGVVKENQQWADIDSERAESERETTGFGLEKLRLVSWRNRVLPAFPQNLTHDHPIHNWWPWLIKLFTVWLVADAKDQINNINVGQVGGTRSNLTKWPEAAPRPREASSHENCLFVCVLLLGCKAGMILATKDFKSECKSFLTQQELSTKYFMLSVRRDLFSEFLVVTWDLLSAAKGSSSQPHKSAASGTSRPQRGGLTCVFRVAQGQMWNKYIVHQQSVFKKLYVGGAELNSTPYLKFPWGVFMLSLNLKNRLHHAAHLLLHHTWLRCSSLLFHLPGLPALSYQTLFFCCNHFTRCASKIF